MRYTASRDKNVNRYFMYLENRDLFPFVWGSFGEEYTWVHGRGQIRTRVMGAVIYGPESEGVFLVPNHKAPVGKRRFYRVLEESPTLYRIFANVPLTQEGILSFANTYG